MKTLLKNSMVDRRRNAYPTWIIIIIRIICELKGDSINLIEIQTSWWSLSGVLIE